jgi:hypothetical protein
LEKIRKLFELKRDEVTEQFVILHNEEHFDLHGSGAHPASYPVGTSSFTLGVKRPGREADHSPPSSAEVKECMELYLHFPIRFHGVVLS